MQPFDPWALVLIAVLNPVVWVVGVYMGQRIDQWQKFPVAGFAAALAGYVAIWLVIFVGLLPSKGIGGATGIFVMDIFVGMLAAFIGSRFPRPAAN